MSGPSTVPTDSKLPKLREDNRTDLYKAAESLLSQDAVICEMLQTEAVGADEVMDEIRMISKKVTLDAESRLREVKKAEQARDILLGRPSPWYGKAAVGAVIAGFISIYVLLGVFVAKSTGSLHSWPIWPFIAFLVVSLTGGAWILRAIESRDAEAKRSATAAVEDLRAIFHKELISLIITPAIERATSIRLIAPSRDKISLTDTQSISSRIESGRRIETNSYRDVLTNLGREGGATIGLAGTRGVGKSELLQAFCDDSTNPPSIESGGVIGISIPAPVAYEVQPFLRLVIRRLAEAVPGYDKRMLHSARRSAIWQAASLLLAVICLITGLALVWHVPTISRHTQGWALIAVASLITIIWVAWQSSARFSAMREVRLQIRLMPFLNLQARLRPLSVTWRRSTDSERRGARINQGVRRVLARTAADVARRVRYVETRSVSSEASASWHNLGFKRVAGISLDQVPLTEPDLVLELSNLVTSLRRGAYQIRIGIDELDKLVRDDDAEKFLTGIKALFAIRDCSFLLTISENAFAQFARRGMPIRDVFDSSLDAVIVVRPLTLYEARRLIRTRLSIGHFEEMTDTQVMLCHCLAGGLPRDFLRICRKLGEVNGAVENGTTLGRVVETLLREEMNTRIEGVRFALQAEDAGEAATAFIAELEIMNKATDSPKVHRVLHQFLSNDSSFANFCRLEDVNAGFGQVPRMEEGNWIRDSRRQLCSYLYFLETVRGALRYMDQIKRWSHDDTNRVIDAFEHLNGARRQMEMDPAAGWRATSDARHAFELTPIETPYATALMEVLPPT